MNPKTRIVFVGWLKPKTTEAEIHEAFSKCGEIEFINILTNSEKKPKGAALITYKTPEQAQKAVDELNDTNFCNSIIFVELRKTKEQLLKLSNPNNEEIFNDKEKNQFKSNSKEEKNDSSTSSESEDNHKSHHRHKHKHHHHHKHHRHHKTK